MIQTTSTPPKVRVSSLRTDGEADLAMERVSFSARRWQDG